MSDENDLKTYFVKTTHGYYYAVGGGRYGRLDGARLDAWALCEKHADELVQLLADIAPEAGAEKEEAGARWCVQCRGPWRR